DADIEANRYICKRLQALTPDILIVAEEDEPEDRLQAPTLVAPPGERAEGLFWLVDPLDGTRAFVNHQEEFSVNIGLVQGDRPVLGIIYGPVQDALYYGGPGLGAFRRLKGGPAEPIATRRPPQKLVITRSRSHAVAEGQAFID